MSEVYNRRLGECSTSFSTLQAAFDSNVYELKEIQELVSQLFKEVMDLSQRVELEHPEAIALKTRFYRLINEVNCFAIRLTEPKEGILPGPNPYQQIVEVTNPVELNLRGRVSLDTLPKGKELKEKGFKEMIQVKGDGNCFYRGVFVSLVQHSIHHGALLNPLIDYIEKKIHPDPQFSTDLIELREILKQMQQQQCSPDWIYTFQATNRLYDLGMVRLFRSLTIDYFLANQHQKCLHGLSPNEVLHSLGISPEEFVQQVEGLGNEAEYIVLDLLPKALGIQVEIADCSGRDLSVTQHGEGFVAAHLLYRTGHYDIIYK